MSAEPRMTGFNFLERPELPAPQVSVEQAQQLLATYYGSSARAEALGSQQDKNFLVFDDIDEAIGVLKVANPAFTATELEAQDAAAQLIAEAEPTVRVAVPQPNVAGQPYSTVTGLLDDTAYVRLLRYLPGGTLLDDGYLSPTVVAGMGDLAGRVSRALADFTHPGLDRAVQWDLRYAKAVVDELISHVPDPAMRERIAMGTDHAWARVEALATELPRQAVHLDLTDANIVARRPVGGPPKPDGIIDFGDLSDTWAVSELAITMSAILGHPGARTTSILPGVKAFHRIRPLSVAEAQALWPLLVLRTAVLLVNGFNGLGLHTLLAVVRMFPKVYTNFVFVQVGVLDAGNFKGASEVENLREHSQKEVERYVTYMGGAENVLARARESFAEGDYRWVVEVVNHVVFADPANEKLRQ